MKSQLIANMSSFALGTGATLVALASWLGTADLQEIKDSVSSYVSESEEHASALVEEYNVMVDQANAEIGDYKAALDKANSNISQLIEKYEQDQAQAGEDISDLQAELEAMQARLDQQYESDMNEVVEQANAQINQANEEVAQTKVDVQNILGESQMETIAGSEKSELDMSGDKSVSLINNIVGLKLDNVENMGEQYITIHNGGMSNSGRYVIYALEYNDGKTYHVAYDESTAKILGLSVDGERYVIYYPSSGDSNTFENTYKPLFDEYLASQE